MHFHGAHVGNGVIPYIVRHLRKAKKIYLQLEIRQKTKSWSSTLTCTLWLLNVKVDLERALCEDMKKYYINKCTLFMLIAVITGAISQPLVAFAFISVDSIYLKDSNLEIANFYFEIFLIILAMLLAGLSHFIKSFVSNNEMNHLRKDMFFEILNKSPSKFHEKDSGEYYNYVLKKVDAWQSGYYDQSWNIIQQILELICIFYLVFSMNMWAGFISIIILLPLVLNNLIFPNIIGKAFAEFLEQDSKMVVKLKEFLAGFDSIKYNSGEEFFSSKLNEYFNRTNKCNQYVSILNNTSGTIANVCVVISQAGGVGIGLVLMLKELIGIGQFIALIQLLSYVNEPVIKLINSTVAFASVKNVNKELAEQFITDKENNEAKKMIKLREIQLKNISYRYEGKQDYVFRNFSVTFERGKKYLIIGESGSGKSTLIKIIMGAVSNFEGAVLFNNETLKEKELYDFIGLVPQDIFIFDDSIRNNIDLLQIHSDEEVEEVIQMAELNKLVDSGRAGMNSKINGEVLQVSGGERARIGLARALIENKQVIIFDEILSSLDKDNAYKIEKKILELNDKIIINIAHKHSEDLADRYDQVIDLNAVKKG